MCTRSAVSEVGCRENGLYILDELKVSVVVAATTTADLSSFRLSHFSSSFYLWHYLLGHISSSRLRFLASTWALGNLQPCDISDCNGCKLAKFFTLAFNQSIYFSSFPFDLIHSDVLLLNFWPYLLINVWKQNPKILKNNKKPKNMLLTYLRH